MSLHYEDDYAENKELLQLYFEDYTKLVKESPYLQALSFDGYVAFAVQKSGIGNRDDMMLDIFTHLRQKR